MDNRSTILGLFTLGGLVVGWMLNNIMVWTFVGMGIGYIVTFWFPYFLRQRQEKRNNKSDK